MENISSKGDPIRTGTYFMADLRIDILSNYHVFSKSRVSMLAGEPYDEVWKGVAIVLRFQAVLYGSIRYEGLAFAALLR